MNSRLNCFRVVTLCLFAILPASARSEDSTSPGIDALIKDLREGTGKQKRDAALALDRLGKDALPAVDALVEALHSGDHQIWYSAARAISNLGPEGREAIQLLAERLHPKYNPGWHRQRWFTAAYTLGRIGHESVLYLIGLLQDKEPLVRGGAALALGYAGEQAREAVPALLLALEEKDAGVRERAAQALGRIGAPAFPNLLKGLSSSSTTVAQGCARALAEMEGSAVTAHQKLISALEHNDPVVRNHVVSALARSGAPGDVLTRILLPRLADSSIHVGSNAAVRLLKLNLEDDPLVIGKLNEKLITANPNAVASTAFVIARLGKSAHRSVGPLLEALLRSKDSLALSRVSEALGRIGLPAVSSTLKAFAHPNADARRSQSLMDALVAMGDEAMPQIVEALRTPVAPTRAGAARTLGSLGKSPEGVIPAIEAALDDTDATVRASAAFALGRLGKDAEGAIPRLVQSTRDADPAVRSAALEALTTLGFEPGQHVGVLMVALADADVTVRRSAARGLLAVGSEARAAIQELIVGLGDADAELRKLICKTLARNAEHAASATVALAKVVDDENKTLRLESLEALSALGPKATAAVPTLVALVDHKDMDTVLRGVRTLGQIGAGAQSAVPRLSKHVTEGYYVLRAETVRALRKIIVEPETVCKTIEPALEDGHVYVREAAIETLAELGPDAQVAVPLLFRMLYTTGTDKENTLRVLPKMKPRSIPLLHKGLKHEGRFVRIFCATRLGELGAGAAVAIPDLEHQREKDSSTRARNAAGEAIRKIRAALE